jgi:hypothetical protein
MHLLSPQFLYIPPVGAPLLAVRSDLARIIRERAAFMNNAG